jgi:hypothetical protein
MRLNLFACPVLLWFLIPCVCLGQQLSKKLTNQDVIEMVSLGLSDGVIIDKIHTTEEADFDTSLAGLKALKAAKVSDAVIRAMINPHPGMTVSQARAVPTANTSGVPREIGVYVVVKGKLTEIEPEIVNWQTGGVLKKTVSLGIVKGDKNGKIMRAKSPTRVPSPGLEFLIKTPEGTSVEEYQLLRLHEKNNRREFRSVTGGILHVSGGAQRDDVVFQPEKIGDRIWRIRLKNLPNGEYGLLPPGIESASISSSGKMYTFGVIEGESTTTPWTFSPAEGSPVQDVTTPHDNPAPQIVRDGSIGVASDENPKVRRDGVTLSRVVAGGPANKAGIQAGDAILAIDNHYIFTAEELTQEISSHKPGTRIAVRYRRHATIYDTYLIVGHADSNQ